jgi:hypothetical protein
MSFDMTIPSGCDAQCVTLWAELKAAHDAIWQALLNLDDSKAFSIVSRTGQKLGAFTAGEFKFRFPRMTWKLVLEVPANGGVGATVSYPKNMKDYSKWTGADTFVRRDGLVGYGAWKAKGYNYLSLHETAHTTMAGLKMTDDCWRDHDRNHHDTYQTGCPDWERNERFANDIALIVARALGIEIIGTANPGFDMDALAVGPAVPQTPEAIPLKLLDIGPRTKPDAARKKAAPGKKAAKAKPAIRKTAAKRRR